MPELMQLDRAGLYRFEPRAATELSVLIGRWREDQEDDGLTEEDGLVSMDGFRYHVFRRPTLVPPSMMGELAWAIIAEPIQAGGPREPALIWSGTRWFSSEDGTEEELAMGRRLSALCPGGIGGF